MSNPIRELVGSVISSMISEPGMDRVWKSFSDAQRERAVNLLESEVRKHVCSQVSHDTIRVLRLIEFQGPRAAVEEQIKHSVHGTKRLPSGVEITATTLGEFPEIIGRTAPVGFFDAQVSYPDRVIDDPKPKAKRTMWDSIEDKQKANKPAVNRVEVSDQQTKSE